MATLPNSVNRVIEEFRKLPGIGPKSATRLVYYFLRSNKKDATRLGKALIEMDNNVVFCSKCYNISDKEICDICSSPIRNKKRLCIVEDPLDVVAFEDAGVFDGVYFVLGGVISPADGISAEELRFPQLRERISELVNDISQPIEVIVATNPSLEGEATAMYIKDFLAEFLNKKKIVLTRLAMGLPTGADLEYADRLTLKRALDGRRNLN